MATRDEKADENNEVVMSEEFRNFVAKTVHKDPAQRLDIDQLLQEDWLKDASEMKEIFND